MKDRVFVETKPFKPPDADGFSEGIIHSDRHCEQIQKNEEVKVDPDLVAVYPTFENKWDHYSIKVGRGAWLKIRKENRCKHCFKAEGEIS